MPGQHIMSPSSRRCVRDSPAALKKRLRAPRKLLSMTCASPPPPSLYRSQWLSVDDYMQDEKHLLKQSASMSYFQDLDALDEMRQVKQEVPELDMLEYALAQMREDEAAFSSLENQHQRSQHTQSSIPSSTLSRDSMVVKDDGSLWTCESCFKVGGPSSYTSCFHVEGQLVRVEGQSFSHSYNSKQPKGLDAAEMARLRVTRELQERRDREALDAKRDAKRQRDREAREAQRMKDSLDREAKEEEEKRNRALLKAEEQKPTLPPDSGSRTRASNPTNPVKPREHPTKSEGLDRPFQARDNSPILYPFTTTRSHFADTAHLPLLDLEDVSEPRSRHLAADYDITSGNTISPVFLMPLPFGSVIETANVYHDERCEECKSGMGCAEHDVEAGTQGYKPHATLN